MTPWSHVFRDHAIGADRRGKCTLAADDARFAYRSLKSDTSSGTDTIQAVESTPEPPCTIATATKLFCSFADQTRLAIITVLAGGEQRVTDIVEALGASQANISGHLKCLKECGVVIDRRSGREAFIESRTPR